MNIFSRYVMSKTKEELGCTYPDCVYIASRKQSLKKHIESKHLGKLLSLFFVCFERDIIG